MMTGSTDRGGAAPSVALDRFYRLYGAIGFLPIMLVGLVVIFAFVVPHFLILPNVLNVLRSSSYLVILAVGQMLVLMVGGFDLSVGAVVALSSVSSALVMAGLKDQMADQAALIIVAGVLTGLGCGFLVGLVNGLCVAFLTVSPFMVTLGTASIATGVALLLTNGIPVYGMPVGYVDGFGRALWLKLPSAVYLAIAIVAAVFVLQNFTRMGRYIVAIGGNLQAAIVSGVPTRIYLVATYALCSVFASISGLALTAQIGSGQAAINSHLTLESIAAAVIAGVSLKGGIGRVEMVALGALFLLILTNAMDLLTIDPRIQTIFLGVIVVLAVALDELSTRRTKRV
jgi:ribose transport system permease protein